MFFKAIFYQKFIFLLTLGLKFLFFSELIILYRAHISYWLHYLLNFNYYYHYSLWIMCSLFTNFTNLWCMILKVTVKKNLLVFFNIFTWFSLLFFILLSYEFISSCDFLNIIDFFFFVIKIRKILIVFIHLFNLTVFQDFICITIIIIIIMQNNNFIFFIKFLINYLISKRIY